MVCSANNSAWPGDVALLHCSKMLSSCDDSIERSMTHEART